MKGCEMSYRFAAYAPAGVKRLNALLVAATKSGPVTAFYEKTGVDAFSTTPEELAKFQLAETRKWGEIIKKANIQPE